jgi:acetolactate synthase-1/2/3 large subunit
VAAYIDEDHATGHFASKAHLVSDYHHGHTFLGDPRDLQRIYPDYVDIAKGFGVTCERVIHKKDLPAAMKRMLDSKEVYILDVMTPYTEHVLPMIPSGKTYKDIITE